MQHKALLTAAGKDEAKVAAANMLPLESAATQKLGNVIAVALDGIVPAGLPTHVRSADVRPEWGASEDHCSICSSTLSVRSGVRRTSLRRRIRARGPDLPASSRSEENRRRRRSISTWATNSRASRLPTDAEVSEEMAGWLRFINRGQGGEEHQLAKG